MNNVLKAMLALSIFSAPLMVHAQDSAVAPVNPTTIPQAKQEVKQDKQKLHADKKQYGKNSEQVKDDRAKLRADRHAKKQMKKKAAGEVNAAQPSAPVATGGSVSQ